MRFSPKRSRPWYALLCAYLWALPTTLLGVIFIPLAIVSGGRMRLVRGVLEIHGGFVEFFLRKCIPLQGGASAMTLGHIVLGRDQHELNWTRGHERVHVRQAEIWGPLFVPAYLTASLVTWMRGQNAYMDNPFEREAFGRER